MTAAVQPMPAAAFTATPKQRELMELLNDGRYWIVGFGGAIRGTKTIGMLSSFVTLCAAFPRSRWAVVRKDLPTLRRNTLPSFSKVQEWAGGFVGPVNKSDWTARCSNGSEIIFFPESLQEDPELNRWKGLEVNGIGLEEANELSERSYHKAIERAGTWIIPGADVQPPPYILATFNPCPNWPRRVFYLPWKNATMAPPYAFLPATHLDNPFVGERQREAWKQMPAHEYKQFVLGDWEVLAGAYYDALDAKLHVIARETLPERIPEHWECWGAFDWGYRHWAVFGVFCKTADGTIVLLDSVWLRREQDAELAKAAVKLVDDLGLTGRCRTALAGHDCWQKVQHHGASGVTVADVFADHGLYLDKADIDLVNGGRALNRALKVRGKKAGLYFVSTPGNLRLVDQVAEIVPDPNDIRKPKKVNADDNGVGGDDGADMLRYGIASQVPAGLEPEAPKDPWNHGQDMTRFVSVDDQAYESVGELGYGF